ncbi:MauE/DoxX family redox-associated membrane protein [Aquimarina sp. 2201CG1-2-11]|uniref:MauE/DoxX family redox-associated membrane protein n=1 Tax=Aquimarina discodermiae TaxID=3231043 RepID=UPI0034633543
MKHTYHIQGMTCNGCRSHVEDTLSKLSNVKSISVDLLKEEAIIEMERHIPVMTLQEAISDKYRITEKRQYEKVKSETQKSKLQQLKPLSLILFYITVASILLHKDDFDVSEMMLDFMGLFYIVFSFFKLLDLKGFPKSFRMYDPLAGVVPVYAWIYPFIEIALGLMFLMRFKIQIALIITLFILGATTFGVVRVLLDKKPMQCACLGTALKLPMTEATFIENAIMIVMAIVMFLNF